MARLARTSDVPLVAALYHRIWHESQAPFMPAEESALRTPSFFVDRMTGLLTTTLVEEAGSEIAGFAAWRGDLLGQVYVASA